MTIICHIDTVLALLKLSAGLRCQKGLYNDTLKSKAKSKKAKDTDKEQEEVKQLPHKKTGQPLLLGVELDTQVQEYIKDKGGRT